MLTIVHKIYAGPEAAAHADVLKELRPGMVLAGSKEVAELARVAREAGVADERMTVATKKFAFTPQGGVCRFYQERQAIDDDSAAVFALARGLARLDPSLAERLMLLLPDPYPRKGAAPQSATSPSFDAGGDDDLGED